MRFDRRLFYPKISQRSCNVQHFTCPQKVAMHSLFNIIEFQACFSTYYFTWKKCVQCAFASQRMRVERRGFYRMISQRFCYLKHLTCTQKVAIYCMFNIKQFQAYFPTLYYTLSKCILHGKSAYSVRLNWRECALIDGCFIQRYCSDPAMYSTVPSPKKQPCTVCSILKSFKHVFQCYIILLASYFTWEKSEQFALHCRECALKDECFILRYRSDPGMYSTVSAPKKQPCTICSI